MSKRTHPWEQSHWGLGTLTSEDDTISASRQQRRSTSQTALETKAQSIPYGEQSNATALAHSPASETLDQARSQVMQHHKVNWLDEHQVGQVLERFGGLRLNSDDDNADLRQSWIRADL